VAFSRSCSENRAVLQFSDDQLQPAVRLQGDMLRVLVADWTQPAAEFVEGNEVAAEAAALVSVSHRAAL
jgi:hypothetical protein